jgi:amidase
MNLTDLTALELHAGLRSRAFSCVELMLASLERIDQINPVCNAIVARRDSALLMAEARDKDAALARGEDQGFLHGLPQAIKDLSPVQGMVTSMGSPNLKDAVSASDSLMVARMRSAGAIFIGRSNTPEFGLGSHTFNPVYGRTGNAYQALRSAGGSSGGAAVALAHRLLPVADGSDFMGSLRNPAGWNNVFGLRPSQGLVPFGVDGEQFVSQLGTEGPMARNVRDLAALLAVQAGYDARAPLSQAHEGARFAQSLKPRTAVRVGWLGDLGGYLPTEPGILSACEDGLARLQQAGAKIESVELGFAPEQAWQCWLVWRRWLVSGRVAPFYKNAAMRSLMKPEAQWEAEQGDRLSGEEVFNASVLRTQLFQAMRRLFDRFDVLAMPSAQVWPFEGHLHWPKTIHTGQHEVAMDTYHRWMEVVIYPTLAGLPSLCVPVGFSKPNTAPGVPAGLPAGMQLIGAPRGDLALLDIGAGYENLIGDWLSQRPAQA